MLTNRSVHDRFVGFLVQDILSSVAKFEFCSVTFIKGVISLHMISLICNPTSLHMIIVQWASDDIYGLFSSNII